MRAKTEEDPLPRSSPLLRLGAPGTRRTDEADPGMARSQRFLNDSKHLFSSRIQLEAVFGRRDAERAWAGFSVKGRSQQCAHIAGFMAERVGFEPTVPGGTTDIGSNQQFFRFWKELRKERKEQNKDGIDTRDKANIMISRKGKPQKVGSDSEPS